MKLQYSDDFCNTDCENTCICVYRHCRKKTSQVKFLKKFPCLANKTDCEQKVVVVTVDSDSNMDVAAKKLQTLKLQPTAAEGLCSHPCFKVSRCNEISFRHSWFVVSTRTGSTWGCSDLYLWPSKSNQFILESKWTSVPHMKKLLRGFTREGQSDAFCWRNDKIIEISL